MLPFVLNSGTKEIFVKFFKKKQGMISSSSSERFELFRKKPKLVSGFLIHIRFSCCANAKELTCLLGLAALAVLQCEHASSTVFLMSPFYYLFFAFPLEDKGRRNGSVVKSTHYFSRVPRFNPQYPHDGSQEDAKSSSVPMHQTCTMELRLTCRSKHLICRTTKFRKLIECIE